MSLPDGGEHIITIASFLSPLAPGRHTSSSAAVFNGALIQSVVGVCFFDLDYKFAVTVART